MLPSTLPKLDLQVKKTAWIIIGARGFEPPTSCAQGRRASQAAPRPECPSLCHTLAMIVAVVFLIYSALLFVEAVSSYRSSRAKPTLIAGICSAAILVVAAVLILMDVPIAASIGIGVLLAMLGVFGSRYLKTRAFFPSGLMMIASLMTLGVLLRILKQ